MAKAPDGFVPLTSLRGQRASPEAALDEIRQIYFKTTKQTIEHDFAHAIELLKSLESEEDREKAAVYMHGLAEMRREWARGTRRAKGAGGPGGGSRREAGKRNRGGT